MFFSIAKNNIKKSFKDYTIYFLTLSFAVCIFYAFNSIGSQSAMKTLSDSQKAYMESVQSVMNILSVFVSIILGALIIYANNFLIKRRKKELGLYMTLGMSKNKISGILVLETLMVGIVSLVVGLLVGLIISQGLSVVTAKMFGGIISNLTFVISYSAIIKTIIYFGIIFVLVMLFNTILVSKYKLIDLLTASKKNEKIKVRNKVLLGMIFILGILLLLAGYYMILKNGFDSMESLYLAVSLGTVGTFLFFYGLSSFIIILSSSNKNRYLRGLNIFITKQMNNKINTTFVSMSLISLMLFVTISALSTGVSMKNATESSVKQNTPFLVSTQVYNDKNVTKDKAIDEINQKIYKDTAKDLNTTAIETVSLKGIVILKNNIGEEFKQDFNTNYMTLSNYNLYLKSLGEKPINLEENKVRVIANSPKILGDINKVIAKPSKLIYDGKSYEIENKKTIENSFYSESAPSRFLTIIIPDSIEKTFTNDILEENLIVNSTAKPGVNTQKVQEEIRKNYIAYEKIDSHMPREQKEVSAFYFTSTKLGIIEGNQGMTTIILYIAIYIGIIFLLTSSAIIALQQLVEATDSKERYDILRKIGATKKMINKAILKQIVLAFILPLGLAIVDAIIAIKAVSGFVESFGKSGIIGASVITGGVIIIIYGGYMFATYIGFKNAVKEVR